MLNLPKGQCEFLMGIQDPEQLDLWLKTNSSAIGLAFVGRSNVGKSSLINSIFGKSTARVSKTPGRTQQINIFKFRLQGAEGINLPDYYLFDLPGYGHAEVSKQMQKNWRILMEIFFSFASFNTAIISIQDARHPNGEVDQQFLDFLKTYSYESLLILNKMDKLKTQKERNELQKKMPEIFKQYKAVKQIFYLSAETGKGVKELHDALVAFLLKKTEINYGN
jgi:GTP-binding protein